MKLSKETLQKIKSIEIQTRRLLSGTLMGDYSSAQKGSGLEFDQIRDYQMGDDVRFIDWNASARSNKILVKQYIEERNRTIMLLVDQSASTFFGSGQFLKSEIIAQVASVLALVGDAAKDHVGAVLFADQVNKVIPPKRGRQHIHTLMETIFTYKPAGQTSLKSALERLIQLQKQPAMVFIISDFLDDEYETLLKIAARKHEVVAIRCLDKRELDVPNCGTVQIKDPETGQEAVLQTGVGLNKVLQNIEAQTAFKLKKCGVELLEVAPDRHFVGQLIRFFRKRMMY